MAKTLYDWMDWPEIETITYSESDDPHAVLGAHKISKGLLVQAFYPDAEKIVLKLKENGKEYPMELMDELGFFAVLLPKKAKPEYTFVITESSGKTKELEDPYLFDPVWEQTDTQKFNCGIHYKLFEKMGAIPMTINGVDGTLFSVWAPNAVRVSVVGSFNEWDGRVHQMRRLWDCGVFELFIPGVAKGSEYKYEIKLKRSHISMKSDPYAHAVAAFPHGNSVVTDLDSYDWQDNGWMQQRKKNIGLDVPVSIYQLHLNTFAGKNSDGSYRNYRELAPDICNHVKDMGYTHIQLMPVMEYQEEESLGYHTFGYYAPTSRFGKPEDLQYMIDYMHREGIGVLLEWSPIYFDLCNAGLRAFDGTFLYEHRDERQGYHKREHAGIFNYARPEVKNFLIANALYWIEKFHIDGITVHKADAVLYLDYNKKPGEWLPNMYGGNENIDGTELFKHMNSVIKELHEDVLLLGEDKSGWQDFTGNVKEGALGFDMKFNDGWTEDVLSYMQMDPLFRSGSYYDMLMGMVYAYKDKFVLPVSYEYVRGSLGSLYRKMPGNAQSKIANLKVFYGYLMTQPGKKMLFMGQDYGEKHAWDGVRPLDMELKQTSLHKELADYVAAWNTFYKKHPALYAQDFTQEGFEWINQISANENIIVFVRKSEKKEDTLLIVINFVPVKWENYKIGVPYPGKYKEVFNSDAVEFGGTGFNNPRVKTTKEDECDGRADSIRIKVAGLSISVFQFSEQASSTKKPSALKDSLKSKVQQEDAIGDVEKQLKAAQMVAKTRKKRR